MDYLINSCTLDLFPVCAVCVRPELSVPAQDRTDNRSFREKLQISRLCGLFWLLGLLTLASGVALADSGNPRIDGYPFNPKFMQGLQVIATFDEAEGGGAEPHLHSFPGRYGQARL